METEGGKANSANIVVVGSLPGMVPFFDEHTARRKAGYTLPEWRALDWIDRAIEVALFRLDSKIEAIMQEEAEEKSRQSMRRKG